MTAYGYLRISTDGQEDGFGLALQAEKIRSMSGDHALQTFADTCSGTTPIQDRPGFLDLLGVLRKGDTVYVYSLSRVARDVGVAVVAHRMVDDRGARIVSADTGDAAETPERALLRTILYAVAQYEREVIKARMAAGKREAVKAGRFPGGHVPYGMRLDAESGKLVVDAREESVIQSMVTMVRKDGLTMAEVARSLNDSDVRARGGKTWNAQRVARALGYRS